MENKLDKSGSGKKIRAHTEDEDARISCTRVMLARALSGKFSLQARRDIRDKEGSTFMGCRL
jgi:hypothetical protein